MATIPTKDGTAIVYKDWGLKDAQPIVFHHGWPLSSDDWDAQMVFFLGNGYRVVAHDRRGHGRSSQVATGHDMDHYASDASAVAEHLEFEECDPHRPLDWRWRGSALCRKIRRAFGAELNRLRSPFAAKQSRGSPSEILQ
jgi:pimeloyl-ACP methyl ester carboxylesterase